MHFEAAYQWAHADETFPAVVRQSVLRVSLEMSVLMSAMAVSAAGVLMGLRFKAPALIAATALAHQLPVYTCNPADFDKIDGLKVVPVGLPEHASG